MLVDVILRHLHVEALERAQSMIAWDAMDVLKAAGTWLIKADFVSHLIQLTHEQLHRRRSDIEVEILLQHIPACGTVIVVYSVTLYSGFAIVVGLPHIKGGFKPVLQV